MTTTISLEGQVVLEMGTTRDGITLVFPTDGPEEEAVPFASPLDELPNATAPNHLGAYIVGTMLLGDGGAPDSPGCDWFPDTRCTLGRAGGESTTTASLFARVNHVPYIPTGQMCRIS